RGRRRGRQLGRACVLHGRHPRNGHGCDHPGRPQRRPHRDQAAGGEILRGVRLPRHLHRDLLRGRERHGLLTLPAHAREWAED
ncbi:unnamed protein product, partial [Ectocarpus sp. 4 AP-2014]